MPPQSNRYDILDQVPEALKPVDPATQPQVADPRAPLKNNRYSILDEPNEALETQLAVTAKATAGGNADKHADTMRIATASGLPVEVIERDYERMKAAYPPKPVNYKEVVERTPKLANWLTDPNNAKLLKEGEDELGKMGALEWFFTAPGRAVSQEMNRANYSELRAKQMLGGTLTPTENDAMNSYKYHAERDGDLGVQGGFFAHAWTGLYRLASQWAPGAGYGLAGAAVGGAGGFVVGGPPGAVQGARTLGSLGIAYGTAKSSAILESVETYDELLQMHDESGQPIDPDVARMAAITVGGINGMIEVAGLGAFMKRFPGLDKLTKGGGKAAMKAALMNPGVRAAMGRLAKNYIGGVAAEVGQEVAQQGVSITAQELAKFASGEGFQADTQRTKAQAWAELVDTAFESVPEFALGMAPGPMMQFRADTNTAKRATANVEFFKALGEGVKDNKLAERMPSAFERFVEDASEPVKTLYQDADAWVAYWQSKKMNPADVAAEVTGDPKALDKALVSGTLPIETSKYAARLAGTEHNAYFVNELRLGPLEMNGREADAFNTHVEATAKKIAEDARLAKLSPEEQALEAIRQYTSDKLSNIGVPRETASTMAEFMAGVGRLAQRAGFDAGEVFGQYGLEVDRRAAPEVQSTGELRQDAAPKAAPEAGEPPVPTAADEEIPGLGALEASLGGATIEQRSDGFYTENASGESAASQEALSRQEGMRARGEQFVVYDRAGRRRVLSGPDAVDYKPAKGETYGVESPQGFSLRENNGGRVPTEPGGSRTGRTLTTLFQGAQPEPVQPSVGPVTAEPGEANTAGVKAAFAGYLEGFKHTPTSAIYKIIGGTSDGQMANAETLARRGIPLPPTPPLLAYNARNLAATTPLRTWFGNSVVVDAKGEPRTVFHGTTAVFTTFDKEKAGTAREHGAGFYFSGNADDADTYADPAHTENQFLSRTFEIEDELMKTIPREPGEDVEDYTMRLDKLAKDQARQEIFASEGLTMPVFLKIERPAVMGGPNETTLDRREAGGTGTIINFTTALQKVAPRFYQLAKYSAGMLAKHGPPINVESLVMDLLSREGPLTLTQIKQALMSNEDTKYAQDVDGYTASPELFRATLEEMGFDGVIATAGTQRYPVEHFVAFQPNQIKSAIGNKGTFDLAVPTILFQSTLEPSPASHVYHSRLLAVIKASKRGAGTGAEWKKEILAEKKIGVNREEFAIAKMDDLRDDARYDKASVIAHFELNNPLAGIVILGDPEHAITTTTTRLIPVEQVEEERDDDDERELDEDAVREEEESVREDYENDAWQNFDDWDDITGEATTIEDEIEDEEEIEVQERDDDGNLVFDDDGDPVMTTETETTTRTVYYPAVQGGYRRESQYEATRRGHNYRRVVSRDDTEVIEDADSYDDEDEAQEAAERAVRDMRDEDWVSERVSEAISDSLDWSDIQREAERRLRERGEGFVDDDEDRPEFRPTFGPPQLETTTTTTIPRTQFSSYILDPPPVEGTYREGFVTAYNIGQSTHVIEPKPKDVALAMFGSKTYDGLHPLQKALVDAAVANAREEKTLAWDWRDGHSQYDNVKNPIVRIRWSVRETVGEKLPPLPEPEPDEYQRQYIEKGAEASAKLEEMRVTALARKRDDLSARNAELVAEGSSIRYSEEYIDDVAGPDKTLDQARAFMNEEERDAFYDLRNEARRGADASRELEAAKHRAANPGYARGKKVLFLEEVQPPKIPEQKKMPPVFIDRWRDIAFKFALHYAVEHNFDTVAWTTGRQQADTWSLDKQVQSVVATAITVKEKPYVKEPTTLKAGEAFELEPEPQEEPYGWGKLDPAYPNNVEYEVEGTRQPADVVRANKLTHHIDVTLSEHNTRIKMEVNEHGTIVFAESSNEGIRDKLRGMPLAEAVGQEMAEKILAHKGDEDLTFEGKGLRMGGTGLKRLYEFDFVSNVKNLPAFKKHGGTVGTVKMEAKVEWEVEAGQVEITDEHLAKQGITRAEPDSAFVVDMAGTVIKEFHGLGGRTPNADAARAYVNQNKRVVGDQPALFITPEVANAVSGGQWFLQEDRYHPQTGMEKDARDAELQAVVQATGAPVQATLLTNGEIAITELHLPTGAKVIPPALPAGHQQRLREFGVPEADIEQMTIDDADALLREATVEAGTPSAELAGLSQEERNQQHRERILTQLEASKTHQRRVTDLSLAETGTTGIEVKAMRVILEHADANNMQVAAPESVAGQRGSPAWNALKREGFMENGEGELYDPTSQGTLIRPSKKARDRHEQGEKPDKPKKPRGALSIDRNRQMTISFFETADLSTFLHETGHFYLEVFGDLVDKLEQLDRASLTPAQLKVMGDYKTLLDYIGVQHRSEITSAHHEIMATGFETYLKTGKAPSLRLRQAFATVKAWMTSIYRSLKVIGIPLTPEVTQVFDRLLASEDEIAQAEAAGELQPMWLTAEAAKMSPSRFALYKDGIAEASLLSSELLDEQQMIEVGKEQSAVYAARKAEVRKEVQAETYAMPVYKAISAMARGLQPDGSPLTTGLLPGEAGEPVPVKLDKPMLIAQYGDAILTKLPRTIYSKDGGVAAGVVANMFGFDSGDALLVAVADAKPMQQRIVEETNRRMAEEEPPMMLDGSIHEAARAAVVNEKREAVLKDELRSLHAQQKEFAAHERHEEARVEAANAEAAYERRWLEAEAKLRIAIAEGYKQSEIDGLTRQVSILKAAARGGAATIRGAIPSSKVVREQAKQAIAATKVIDLDPMLYWGNMRRASQKATAAAARQDFPEAIRQKQRELISMALYRETVAAKKEVEKRVKAAKKIATPNVMASIMKAGHTYHDQVAGLLDRFEFAEVSKAALDRRADINKWILGQEAQGIAIDLPEAVTDEARRTNYKNLSVEELIGVTDGLRQLAYLARFKNRLLKNARTRNLNKLAAGLGISIRANKAALPRSRRDRTSSVERGRMVRNFMASHRKLASLLRELDGFIDGGPMWEAIMRPLNDAAAREAVMNADATKQLHVLLKEAYPTKERSRLYAKTYIPAVDQSLSKMERLMIALNYGNEGNRDRIERFEKWTPQQVQAVLDTLDERDAKFVQGVFDFINQYWDEIAKKQERVFGKRPDKVEAKPFTIGRVQMKGGYFPLKYDDRLSARAQTMLDVEKANLAKNAAFTGGTTARGHTKARTESFGEPVRYDFGVIDEHVMQVIHDLSHHEALIDIGRILAHHDVQTAIMETHGDITYKAIKNSVRDAAFGNIPGGDWFEKALNHTRAGVTVVGLAWSLSTPLMQTLGFANSTVRLRPKWMAKGMMRTLGLGTPRSMIEQARWIHEVSPFMRTRHLTQQRELNEIRNEVGVYSGKISGWMEEALARTTFNMVTKQAVVNSYFAAIGIMQKMVDMPTWSGAYEKAMSDGGSAEGDHERAVAIADQAVLDTQGGGQIKDLASVQRGTPALKIFTNFYSAGNVLFNQAVEIGAATDLKSPAAVGLMLVDYMTLFVLPATMGYFITEALRPGDDDDDDGLVEALVRENLAYLIGSIVGFRELTGAVKDYYGYSGPAGARIFASLSNLIKQVSQGEIDEALLKVANDVGGIILHYPAAQVWKTASGMAALAEGRTDDWTVLATGPEKE